MSVSKGLRAVARSPSAQKGLTAEMLVEAGYPAAGTETGESFARKLSAVDRCIEILSDSMGKLPCFIMDGRSRERVDLPILQLLNVRPNEAMTPFVRKKVLETSRLVNGNGYDWIVRDPKSGRPVELIPVPGQLVEPWRDSSGRVWYTVTHPWTGEPMVLPNEDICHYKTATRDGLKGVGVLRRASETIASARAQQQYELSYYQSGGQPSGILRTEADLGGSVQDPKNPGQLVSRKDLLRREWERVHAGPLNGHRIAIMDFGLDYKPLASSNQDAQFVESKEVTVRDIARPSQRYPVRGGADLEAAAAQPGERRAGDPDQHDGGAAGRHRRPGPVVPGHDRGGRVLRQRHYGSGGYAPCPRRRRAAGQPELCAPAGLGGTEPAAGAAWCAGGGMRWIRSRKRRG